MVKIVFNPDMSDLEEIEVMYQGSSILLKRLEPQELPDDLAKSLLQEPGKFKLAGPEPVPAQAATNPQASPAVTPDEKEG